MKNHISTLQKYIWLDQKLTPTSPKYNIGGYAIINGYVDFSLFKKAIEIFSQENSLFKSVFREESGNPFSVIQDADLDNSIHYFEKDNKQQALDLIKEDFGIPFHLNEDQRLCKVWLIRISANTFIWYSKLHHLIADGFSFQLLFNNVSTIYESLTSEAVVTEKTNSKDFAQHVEEELDYVNSEAFLKDQSYWISKYETFPQLAYNKQYEDATFYDKEFQLLAGSWQEIQNIAKQQNVSVFHVLLASFSVVLSKFNFTEEINLGTPILNRLSRADRTIFGPFINLLPLQIQLKKEVSFLDLIKQIKKDVFTMYRHQRFQQAELIKALNYKGNRLYDARISYESFEYQRTFSSYDTEIVALSNHSEEDPISVHIMDYNMEGLIFRFDINGNYIPEYIADEFIKSLQFVLKNVTSLLNQEVVSLSIATSAQRKEIALISKGPVEEPKSTTFPELWKENIPTFSANEALAYGEDNISYAEVDEKISAVVAYLHKEGIGKGDRVGVLLDRSINTIPVILGVLQSGATYVPIDISFPAERARFIVQDSDIKLTITDASSIDSNYVLIETIFASTFLEVPKEISIHPEDEAYIIYTSGSTGQPKGVSIKHQSLIDYATSFSTYFQLQHSDCVIQQSSFVFDTSIEEIFPILSVGGRLVVSENPKDFHKLLQECCAHRVSLLSTNPFLVQYFNENHENYKHSLRVVISGGDRLIKEQVHKLLDTVEVYNTYGPTESTVCATYHKITSEDSTLPIGKPIANRNVLVINNGQLVPKGALGEIALAGTGLANGYINNEALTKSLFVEIEGERVYKTGDVGRWDSADNLLFYGRKDKQLSFKGYRIEPQEISKAITSVSSEINNCHITIKELHKVPALIAYVSAAHSVHKEQIIEALKKRIPNYMIPNHIVILDALPLNTSGKVDEKKLPLPKAETNDNVSVLPSTETENAIASIWKELLHLEEIDIQTSFFELGGHSLLANQFIGIIRENRKQDISLQEFYESPTIQEIALMLEARETSSAFQLQKAPEQELYPLSYPQERLWFLDQLNKENKAYYVPRAINMTGVLDVSLIEKTFTLLIEKHEILRTVFPVVDGIPYQKVIAPYYFHVPVVPLTELSAAKQEEAIQDFILKEGNLDFDLENGPLLRVYILQKAAHDNLLVFCEHHLIHDGWTQGILLREFIDTYSKLSIDSTYTLSKPTLQFKDFSYWQKQYFNEERLNTHIAFWKEKLDGHIPVLPLPQQNKRPKEISGNGELLIRTIDAELSDKIRNFSTEHNATLFITMLAAFKITLSRFSNETDICVGTAVANRRLASLDNILGMVINTMALRTKFDSNDSLQSMLDKVKETCFETYSYEDTPFGKVVEHTVLDRSIGTMPLFQYAFSFMNTPSRNLFLPDLELEIVDSHNRSAKFDINIVVVPHFEQAVLEGIEEENRTIMVEWEYNSDIYAEQVMNQMFDAYLDILETLVATPEVSYKQIACLPIEQEKQLLTEFNTTRISYPDKTVIDLFRDQVDKTPDAIAIAYEDTSLKYKELEEASNALANALRSTVEISKESLIGVQLDRSDMLIVSLLAVLKTGGAYVAIDPSYPEQRIAYIKEDSQCVFVITEAYIKEFKESQKDTSIPAVSIATNQLAYVIYTSGSTGQPKGVMIEHKSLTNLCFWHRDEYKVDEHTRSTLYSSVAFDASVWEIFPYLCFGGALFPISNEDVRLEILNLSSFLREHRITHCYLPPKIVKELKGAVLPKGLKILAGGEALGIQKITGCELYNNYGPTENTVVTTNYKVSEHDEFPLPIGKPIANTQVYIVDADTHQLQPKGVIGELCVSGDGLARGYLHRPELTKAKFISHPFQEGERLYKTGDLARWLPSGHIEFVGRKDFQVKIRGYRIELGEIEFALTRQENIDQAVVTVVKDKEEQHLVGYFVSNEGLDVETIKHSLREYVPAYMIPHYLVSIDTIPLTPNGKVDHQSLPKVVIDDFVEKEYVAPRNEVEKQLVKIWEEVLAIEKIGITDNFFRLGGHSLKVTQLINRINKELSATIQVKEVFTYPTIASLSEKITDTTIFQTIPKATLSEYYPLTSSQKRLWVLSQFEGGNMAYNIPGVFKMKGRLDIEVLTKSFRYVLDRHESLRTRFVELDGEVYQQVVSSDEFLFTIGHEEVLEKDTKAIITSFYEEEFALSKAPLLKARILQTSANDYYLLFAIHHIVGDGWSMEVFVKELMHAYHQLLSEEMIVLPELKIQYPDYVVWKESKEVQEFLSKQGAYWKDKLSGELPVLELPSYQKRPLVKTYNGATKLYDFSKAFSDKLHRFNQNQGVTLYMSLLAGINGLFYRYTGATDILLGTPMAGRSHPELEGQIGLYLNTLAIRTTFDHDHSFVSLLDKQKHTLLEAYEHQDYPFDRLVEELSLKRDTSRSALFDVMVVLQNQQETTIELENLEIHPYQEVSRQVSQFDMTFSFSESEEGLHLRLEYNRDIYEAQQMDALCIHLERFLDAAITTSEENIGKLPYLTAEEEEELLYSFNDTEETSDKDTTIIDLFRNQVEKTPQAIAIVFDGKELTYQELEDLSNAMANDLLAGGLIHQETLIGVELERSDWLIVSLLAILKTGSAYVPIDPSYPSQRIEYIKQDSQCALVIDADYISHFKTKEKQSHIPSISIAKDQLAYVIYTSGSTGKPKGVLIEHSNVMSLLQWSDKEFSNIDFDITYFTTSHCFDLSVYEIFYTLSIGKKVRVLDNALSIPNYLENDKKVLLNVVPSVVQTFIDDTVDLSNVSILNMAGEVIPPGFTDYLPVSKMSIYNLYGPSEDTTYSTYYPIEKQMNTAIPVGTPIDNTQVYILSAENQLQPKGVIGELCISGAGLSRGYLHRPELTKEKFIPHPFKAGERLYKTGDLAKWLPDGTIEFIGRKDAQVKLRGYRIELGEIEQVVTAQETVKQSVVEVITIHNEKHLAAYIVSENDMDIDKASIKESLRTYLPEYMLPNYFIQLDAIPLTPNGKVDRKALPEIEDVSQTQQEYAAPTTDIEQKLAVIWQEVLGVEKVGVTDNFFELGGNSIKAVKIKNTIDKVFNTDIQVQTFFTNPTIQAVSAIVQLFISKNEQEIDSQEDIEEVII